MDCRKALMEAEGNTERALEILKEQGLPRAKKKAELSTTQGIIEAYIHAVGAAAEFALSGGACVRGALARGVQAGEQFAVDTAAARHVRHTAVVHCYAVHRRNLAHGSITNGMDRQGKTGPTGLCSQLRQRSGRGHRNPGVIGTAFKRLQHPRSL